MRLLRWSLVVVLLLGSYPAYLGFTIWRQSRSDEPRAADAIVVLGAAQYNGEPSPVFRARLDHALRLYEDDLADTLIVTGGKQPGDRFTEADAGARYLEERSVATDAILRETGGRTTLQSLQGVKALADDHGISSVLLVSDPLHSHRIRTIARDLGFTPAYASPANYVELHRSRATKAKELLHEIVSMMAYQFLSR